jgi:choline dehydrogenase-like flavoprotein
VTKHYQFVLIGSGVAATTLAKRLLEKDPGTSILMLEAGPEVPRKDRRAWWDYVVLSGRKPYDYCTDVDGENTTIGDITWGFPESRIMAYGGSTGHWGGWCLRYKPEDFWLRTNTGEGADWPLSYEELEPYYVQAEQYLSVCGEVNESWNTIRAHQPYPLPDFGWTAADGVMIEAFHKVGIEPGKMPLARYRRCMSTGTCKYCPLGSRFTAQAVLEELTENNSYHNFEQRCRSTVVGLVARHKKDTIEAIEVLNTVTGEHDRVHADTFVVCAGTYESPKLLLRSVSSLWPHGIGNDHDLVGRFIVSHSFLTVTGRFPANPHHWLQEYDFPTLMSRTYDAPEYQQDGKVFLFKNRALPNIDIADLMIQGKSRAQINTKLSGPMDFQLQGFYEEKGQYRNRLQPKPGTNRFGLPLTEIRYLRSPRFAEQAGTRLPLLTAVIDAMGCPVVVPANWDDPGGHHATSTCRMGDSPEQGVTDRNMLVFGTNNLYVCSNAAFPSCTAVNPTLTLTAMTMRLADHLKPSPANAGKAF